MASWENAVVRVFKGNPDKPGSEYLGSSFLISDRYLLTCRHVVDEKKVAPKEIFLVSDLGAFERGGVRKVDKPINHPGDVDVALLPLKEPAGTRTCCVSRRAGQARQWRLPIDWRLHGSWPGPGNSPVDDIRLR